MKGKEILFYVFNKVHLFTTQESKRTHYVELLLPVFAFLVAVNVAKFEMQAKFLKMSTNTMIKNHK
jgi:hypothetical protein